MHFFVFFTCEMMTVCKLYPEKKFSCCKVCYIHTIYMYMYNYIYIYIYIFIYMLSMHIPTVKVRSNPCQVKRQGIIFFLRDIGAINKFRTHFLQDFFLPPPPPPRNCCDVIHGSTPLSPPCVRTLRMTPYA